MTDVAGVAGTAKEVIDQIQKVEPWIATIIPMVVPAAAPVMPLINAFEPVIMTFVSRALGDIAGNNGGDLPGALIELFQHLSKGQPNSPALMPTPISGPITG